jgi:hypothetical protein
MGVDEGDQYGTFLHCIDIFQGGGLYAKHHVGLADQSLPVGCENDVLESGIAKLDGFPCASLHAQTGAQLYQSRGDGWHQRYAPLVWSCFFKHCDFHRHLMRTRQTAGRVDQRNTSNARIRGLRDRCAADSSCNAESGWRNRRAIAGQECFEEPTSERLAVFG